MTRKKKLNKSKSVNVTDEAFRQVKIKMIMEYHDVSQIVAECILDAMEEAKQQRMTEYNRVSSMIQDCYPGNNTVH